jgi:heme/copper-type cytochrome/quinol oxidase subunit 2
MNRVQSAEEVLNVAMSTVVFWSVTAAILLAEGAIIVAALKMRVDPDPARGFLGTRPVEIFWTLLPLSLVALMLILSYDEFQGA